VKAAAPVVPLEKTPERLYGVLASFHNESPGEIWPLRGRKVAIGRADSIDGLDVHIRDATVSSRHAAIWFDEASGAITLEDLGSSNGTLVNGNPLGSLGKRSLKDGDRIRFGRVVTVFRSLEPPK
jgi:pSer/pThr/pTyr-binding forkhead associated (FHA) protein